MRLNPILAFNFSQTQLANYNLYYLNNNSFYLSWSGSFQYPEMTSKWFVRDNLPYFILKFNMKMRNVDFDYRINNGNWQRQEILVF